jgi:hypothetical protein
MTPGCAACSPNSTGCCRCGATAGDQAVAVHLRLAAEPHDGYESADLNRALADYHFARGLVLTAVRDITDYINTED